MPNYGKSIWEKVSGAFQKMLQMAICRPLLASPDLILGSINRL